MFVISELFNARVTPTLFSYAPGGIVMPFHEKLVTFEKKLLPLYIVININVQKLHLSGNYV